MNAKESLIDARTYAQSNSEGDSPQACFNGGAAWALNSILEVLDGAGEEKAIDHARSNREIAENELGSIDANPIGDDASVECSKAFAAGIMAASEGAVDVLQRLGDEDLDKDRS